MQNFLNKNDRGHSVLSAKHADIMQDWSSMEEVMLGWVISCRDDRAQEILEGLEKKYGPLARYRAVNFWRGLSVNMLNRMVCASMPPTPVKA